MKSAMRSDICSVENGLVAGVKELGHLVLYVRDLEGSRAFYKDLLGFREIFHQPPAVAGYCGSQRRTHHELLLIAVGPEAQPIPRGRRVGMYHFGLKVGDSDDELRAMLKTLQGAGVTIVGASDHTVSHSLYVLDPDGNELELYIDVPGVDWKSDPALVASPIRPLRL
ncbi:MAG TPA: VOC family protein [Burkholderiales bacterium]|nr:VOC family protein [Burkholderiales bacterium]